MQIMETISYDIPENLASAIAAVKHPAIKYSLNELGIIRQYYMKGKSLFVTFAFPFPNIPIKDKLISSVENPVKELGYSFEYEIVLMTEVEKNSFLKLEKLGWKGM